MLEIQVIKAYMEYIEINMNFKVFNNQFSEYDAIFMLARGLT